MKTPPCICSRDDVRGGLNAVIADLRNEAQDIVKTPDCLLPILLDKSAREALQATAKRIADFYLSETELVSLFHAEIDVRNKIAKMRPEPSAPEKIIMRFKAYGPALAVSPAAEYTGEREYTKAVEILYGEESVKFAQADESTILSTLSNEFGQAARVARIPPIKSANTILSTVYAPPRFLVPGLIPDSGIVVMAASKAAGKTWVLLQIAAAVATGGQAFSRLRCESTRVLFIELELSERRLCERFGKMRLADLPGLDIATAWRIGTEGLADLEAAVKDRGYGLVVVDVLARLWPRGADMNDYSTVYSLLGPLRDMANCLGVCIILVTHTRKTEAEDAIDQVMGSVGIVGTADVILALKRSRGSDDAVLRVDGNDFESQEIVLQFRTDPMGFEAVDIDPRETRLTPERKEVLEALREFEEGTAKEIAAVIGKDPDVVSKQLRALASDGMAVVVRFGVYKASRSGRSGRSDPKELPREYLSSSGRSKSETPTVPTTPTTKYESEFKSLPDAAFSETGTLWI